MSNIEYISFGGQDERNKSCSVLSIDGDLYILNCGISLPPSIVLGVQKVIPDFSWIIKNKNAIKGIFIGTPSYDNFGGLEFLCHQLPNVPIYTTSVGKIIILNYFNHRHDGSLNQVTKLNINTLSYIEPKKIGNINVTAFRIVNYIPFSCGFVFETKDGGIIFVDDFILSAGKNQAFYDMIVEVNRITKNNNLLLITSIGISNMNAGFTSPKYKVNDFFDNILTDAKGRVIVAINDHDVYKVLALASIASKKSLPFTIFSNTFTKLFDYLEINKLVNFPGLLKITDEKINEMKKGVVVVTGTTQRLLAKLQKIIDGEDTKISLMPTDTFVFACPITGGFEKIDASLMDQMNKSGVIETIQLPKSILMVAPSAEDHKFLTNILRPKYIIPQKGLYMDYVNFSNSVKQANIPQKNVLIIENGQIINFNNGMYVPNKKFIKIEEQYIGTQGVLDVAASSLFERDQMAENGVVLASILINKKIKKIINSNYDIVGVTNLTEQNKLIVNKINESVNTVVQTMLNDEKATGTVNWDAQNLIKKQIIKFYEKNFGKRPLVLLTILYNDSIIKKVIEKGPEK